MVLYNRIMDEADGNSSYAVDIPNGGRAYLIGNLNPARAPRRESRHCRLRGGRPVSFG